MSRPYVHGYDEPENARLEDQARTLESLLHHDTAYPPGSLVLEAGCGVGSQTAPLARNSPGARIVAVDVAEPSLRAARARVEAEGLANVEIRLADLRDPPFAPGSFDHVFLCFVLEHLPDPLRVLASLRGLLRPGGTVTAIEGDHGSAYFHPDSEAARRAVAAQVALQRAAGGDAEIGRRLHPLLRAAGFEGVRVSPRMVYVDGSRPDLAEGFTRRTFTAMIRGVRGPALAAGLTPPEDFDAGVRALERTAEADGVFCYTFFKAWGVAP
jgi:SAM-dependent methyltransferase